MALTFTELMSLADGNQLRIREAASPNAIRFAIKIGAAAIDEVTINPTELDIIRGVFNGLAMSRLKDPA